MGGISDLGVKPPDLSFVPDLRSMTGRASWEDPETGKCDGRIWQTMAKIRDALPVGPTTVTISATQVAPRPNYGSWSGVFPKTTCVRAWLSVWAAQDGLAFDNWNPGVCQAMDDKGKAYHFIYNAQSQAAIYPVGANPGQYMGVYLLDRTDAKCDLVGVGNRPGFDAQETNTAVFGTKGDRLSFSW